MIAWTIQVGSQYNERRQSTRWSYRLRSSGWWHKEELDLRSRRHWWSKSSRSTPISLLRGESSWSPYWAIPHGLPIRRDMRWRPHRCWPLRSRRFWTHKDHTSNSGQDPDALPSMNLPCTSILSDMPCQLSPDFSRRVIFVWIQAMNLDTDHDQIQLTGAIHDHNAIDYLPYIGFRSLCKEGWSSFYSILRYSQLHAKNYN